MSSVFRKFFEYFLFSYLEGKNVFTPTKNILLIMEQNGLNARQLELKLNFSNGTVLNWKKGKANPSTKALQKIADYFELPIAYFYEEHENFVETAKAIPTLSDDGKQLVNLIFSLTDEEVAELSKFVDYIISKRQ